MGYSELDQSLNDFGSEGAYGENIDGVYYYYKDKVVGSYKVGVGVNLGFGMEYQISEKIRMFLDQQLAAGMMISWMARIGVSYCF